MSAKACSSQRSSSRLLIAKQSGKCNTSAQTQLTSVGGRAAEPGIHALFILRQCEGKMERKRDITSDDLLSVIFPPSCVKV